MLTALNLPKSMTSCSLWPRLVEAAVVFRPGVNLERLRGARARVELQGRHPERGVEAVEDGLVARGPRRPCARRSKRRDQISRAAGSSPTVAGDRRDDRRVELVFHRHPGCLADALGDDPAARVRLVAEQRHMAGLERRGVSVRYLPSLNQSKARYVRLVAPVDGRGRPGVDIIAAVVVGLRAGIGESHLQADGRDLFVVALVVERVLLDRSSDPWQGRCARSGQCCPRGCRCRAGWHPRRACALIAPMGMWPAG